MEQKGIEQESNGPSPMSSISTIINLQNIPGALEKVRLLLIGGEDKDKASLQVIIKEAETL